MKGVIVETVEDKTKRFVDDDDFKYKYHVSGRTLIVTRTTRKSGDVADYAAFCGGHWRRCSYELG